jgi:hypothetical protein
VELVAVGPLTRRWLAAGVGGTAAITLSSTLEMRLRGRPASTAPIDTVERLLGRRLPDRARGAVGTAAHLASGLALGLPRALLPAREPLGTAAFLPVALLPDIVLVPALGVTDPPWRWGGAELAISVWHHVAYALGAGAGLALLRRGRARDAASAAGR